MKDRLVFVYNADSGLMNTLIDHLHKKLSPATYRCRLCQLTYDGFTMSPEWPAFLDSLGIGYESTTGTPSRRSTGSSRRSPRPSSASPAAP